MRIAPGAAGLYTERRYHYMIKLARFSSIAALLLVLGYLDLFASRPATGSGHPAQTREDRPRVAGPGGSGFSAQSPEGRYDLRSRRILTQVRVYANREIVRLPDGFQPLLATEEEAMRWLASADPAYTVDFKILRSRSLGISLSLRWGYGRRHIDTRMSWVDGISIALGDDEARDRF